MDQNQWLELAASAYKDAGFAAKTIEIITTWEQKFTDVELFRNNAVFRINGEHILKLFGTESQRHFNIERAALQTLTPAFPAPRLVASGTLGDQPYIIMTEIPGKTLQDTWAELSSAELKTVASEIGTQTALLHQQPHDRLADVESQFGGREQVITLEATHRALEIRANERFSTHHKDELLDFLHGKGKTFLDVPPVFTHADLSHAHIYIVQSENEPAVSGWIDWGEAMLGPPEWDIAFHWFWTFSQHSDTMRACLDTYYQDMPRPDQLARHCFATHLYTFSMNEVWDYFDAPVADSESIVRAMVAHLFPKHVFGPPD